MLTLLDLNIGGDNKLVVGYVFSQTLTTILIYLFRQAKLPFKLKLSGKAK
jgi:hypothetical protein